MYHPEGKNEFGVFKISGMAEKCDMDCSTYSIQVPKDYIIKIGAPVLNHFCLDGGPPVPFAGKVISYDTEDNK